MRCVYPGGFYGGIAGQLYRQFAITITISVLVSSVVALTLSPSIAALILQVEEHPPKWAIYFNKGFEKFTQFYLIGATWLIHRRGIGMGLVAAFFSCDYVIDESGSDKFCPEEDQGYLFVIGNLPSGASLERTSEVSKEILDASKNIPGVDLVVSLDGFSLLDGVNRTDISTNFIVLKDWKHRTSKMEHADAILDALRPIYAKIPMQYCHFQSPAIQGLGTVGGFEFWIQNRGGGDITKLENYTKEFIAKTRTRPELVGVFSTFQPIHYSCLSI